RRGWRTPRSWRISPPTGHRPGCHSNPTPGAVALSRDDRTAPRLLTAQVADQALLLHPEPAVLPPVQQDHRDPATVLVRQFRVAVHVHLDPRHTGGLPDPLQRLPRVLAQVAPGPAEQGDPRLRHGCRVWHAGGAPART